jgi:hypothetical protein
MWDVKCVAGICARASKLEAGGWRLEAGGWRLEAGGWRLEAGGWKRTPAAGRWTLRSENGVSARVETPVKSDGAAAPVRE